MNIVEALQQENSWLRLSNGHRWLCGEGNGVWVVYERLPYAKNTTTVIETDDEKVAVKALLNE